MWGALGRHGRAGFGAVRAGERVGCVGGLRSSGVGVMAVASTSTSGGLGRVEVQEHITDGYGRPVVWAVSLSVRSARRGQACVVVVDNAPGGV